MTVPQPTQDGSFINCDQPPLARPLPPSAPSSVPIEKWRSDETEEERSGALFDIVLRSPPWLVSMLIHVVVMIMLGLLTVSVQVKSQLHEILVGEADVIDEFDELNDNSIIEQLTPDIEVERDAMELTDVVTLQDFELEAIPDIHSADNFDPAAERIELGPMPELMERSGHLLSHVSATDAGQGFHGRSAAHRSGMVRRKGGTPGSEAAVVLALQWLAAHQNADGSWSYDHRHGGGTSCTCNMPGKFNTRYGSTALALLPFLGAGHSHKKGQYQQTVANGIYYLLKTMKIDNSNNVGKMLDEGNAGMYAHGLATMTLSEAFGISYDKELRGPAQAAVNWIVQSQGPMWGYHGGGNDTSVSGWQIMALKSAYTAGLQVPTPTTQKISMGLDGLQENEDGAFYGYQGPGNRTATTAVGLLSRMYLGREQNHPGLLRGMQFIAEKGPDTGNIYYTYYATLAMFQYTSGEGSVWKIYNTAMRESLIAAQHKTSHETGSWILGTHVNTGGRLYSTSLCAMCLEVYYRYMPVYEATRFGG